MNMKRFFTALMLCLVSIAFCNAQNTTEKNEKKEVIYCELVGTQASLFKPDLLISVDYGKTYERKMQTWEYISNDDGSAMTFKSMVAAMNYMGEKGWRFEQAYIVTTQSQNVYHWLLSKEVGTDEEK